MSSLPNIPTLPHARPMLQPKSRPLLRLASMLALLLGLSVSGTQFLAFEFNYDQALGDPWIASFYAPWSWLVWQQKSWAPKYSREFGYADSGMMAAYVFLVLLGVRIGTSGRRKPRGIVGLQGTARWITSKSELETAGLLPKPDAPDRLEDTLGVYIGGWTDQKGFLHYLRHTGPEHVAVIAPTRSGKGVGLVLPTLLSFSSSCLINDPKGELWQQTSGWRSQHADNICIRFKPAAESGSCAFNPLDEIRLKTAYAVADAQNLATLLVDPDGEGFTLHWAITSHELLTGLILHLMHLEWEAHDLAEMDGELEPLEHVSLYTLAMSLADPVRPVEQLYEEMIALYSPSAEQALRDRRRIARNDERADPAHPDHHEHIPNLREIFRDARANIATAGRAQLDRADEERTGVQSTARSKVALFKEPIVRNNTARSDFRIHDLMNHDRPVSLYFQVGEEDKGRMRPLVQLFLNQVVKILMRDEPIQLPDGRSISPHKRQMLMMLDEFTTAFGRVQIFEKSLAFVAGWGMKAYLSFQDREQILKEYGQHENILTSIHVRIAYAPNTQATAEWLSTYLGQATILKEEITESGPRGGALSQVSRSVQEIRRPLMTDDEIMHMRPPTKDLSTGDIIDPGDMLISVSGQYAIYGTQILYFKDKIFKERAALPPPLPGRTRDARARQAPLLETRFGQPVPPAVNANAASAQSAGDQGQAADLLAAAPYLA